MTFGIKPRWATPLFVINIYYTWPSKPLCEGASFLYTSSLTPSHCLGFGSYQSSDLDIEFFVRIRLPFEPGNLKRSCVGNFAWSLRSAAWSSNTSGLGVRRGREQILIQPQNATTPSSFPNISWENKQMSKNNTASSMPTDPPDIVQG